MYYITSPSSSTEFALLDISESRGNARAFAKDVGGTVRTQAEFDDLVSNLGRPIMSKVIAKRLEKIAGVETPLVDNSAAPVEAFAPGEAEAIASAVGKAMPGIVAKIQERKAAKATMLDTAKQIKTARKAPKTVGAKPVQQGKRIYTDEADIKEATAAYAKAFDEIGSKVNHVRWVANWVSSAGVKLQRRDAYAILAETDVAKATIDTQWQLVRAGKL